MPEDPEKGKKKKNKRKVLAQGPAGPVGFYSTPPPPYGRIHPVMRREPQAQAPGYVYPSPPQIPNYPPYEYTPEIPGLNLEDYRDYEIPPPNPSQSPFAGGMYGPIMGPVMPASNNMFAPPPVAQRSAIMQALPPLPPASSDYAADPDHVRLGYAPARAQSSEYPYGMLDPRTAHLFTAPPPQPPSSVPSMPEGQSTHAARAMSPPQAQQQITKAPQPSGEPGRALPEWYLQILRKQEADRWLAAQARAKRKRFLSGKWRSPYPHVPPPPMYQSLTSSDSPPTEVAAPAPMPSPTPSMTPSTPSNTPVVMPPLMPPVMPPLMPPSMASPPTSQGPAPAVKLPGAVRQPGDRVNARTVNARKLLLHPPEKLAKLAPNPAPQPAQQPVESSALFAPPPPPISTTPPARPKKKKKKTQPVQPYQPPRQPGLPPGWTHTVQPDGVSFYSNTAPTGSLMRKKKKKKTSE